MGEGVDALEGVRRVRRGNAKEIAQSSRRSSTMQQRSRAIPQEKSSNVGKRGAFQKEVARFGEKVGRYRMKVPLFSHKVSDFSATLGRECEQVGTSKKQVAVIVGTVGALVRRTGFPE